MYLYIERIYDWIHIKVCFKPYNFDLKTVGCPLKEKIFFRESTKKAILLLARPLRPKWPSELFVPFFSLKIAENGF